MAAVVTSPPAGASVLEILPAPVTVVAEDSFAEFLAGRSPNTLAAYARDLAAFAAYVGAGSPGKTLEALIGLRAGEGNQRLLAWRAPMQEAGVGAPARAYFGSAPPRSGSRCQALSR